MKIGIGIDTGGTYTDAVVFDFENKAILGAAKALTTKEDLSVGILNALDALPVEHIKAAGIISLSTTLATNACVEDKGGNAKLIFFGGDHKTIDENGRSYGLPPAKEMLIQQSYTDFSGKAEREVDWDLFRASIENDFHGMDGVGIVEMNATRTGAAAEKKAKELFLQKHNIPVVCGHELVNKLNSLQRGSNALLNARLIPVIREFLSAIKTAMAARGINPSVIIVRSDGGLMSEEFAHTHPVETLLCGPAASVLGSSYLANEPNSIVVDMGGTTTDIALIKNGEPVKVTDGVRIGKWKTFVSGLYINTFGLGGDTAIHYDSGKMFLEDYRVIPLCVAAEKYPYVIENLKELLSSVDKHTKYLHEHYLLVRDISDSPRYTDEEKIFCAALKNGPLVLRKAASSVSGKDIYNLNVSRLLKEGVIQACGLTPTDIMHIKGDFNKFSLEASMLAAQFVASNLDISVDELCNRVYDEIKRKLYVNIVKVMLENKDGYYMKNGVDNEVERFINESYRIAGTGFKQDYISMMFNTDFILAGVGAPIHIFLNDVAKMLGTKAITPKYYEVANALGAIVGNVYVSNVVEIKPEYDTAGITGYTVYGNSSTKLFENIDEAEAYAVEEAKNAAYSEAVKRGAQGDISVSCKLSKNEPEVKGGMLYLGTQAIAQAVGAIGF